MALDAEVLANLMVEKFEEAFGEIQPLGAEALQKMAGAIAQAVVEHIVTDGRAVVSPTDAGLQRDPASSDPTLAPVDDVELHLV